MNARSLFLPKTSKKRCTKNHQNVKKWLVRKKAEKFVIHRS